jgi:ABC-2 type transport system permease protein
VFRAGLKLLVRRPALPLIHLGLLGLIGLMMMAQFGSVPAKGEIKEIKPEVAIIDHDGSQLSKALRTYLEDHGMPVHVGSSKRDLQDAAAKSAAAYIAVIPAGYQAGFEEAARGEGIGHKDSAARAQAMPQLETVVMLASDQGRYMDQLANTYLRQTWAQLVADPDADLGAALTQARQLSDLRVKQSMVERPAGEADGERFRYYLGFVAYPLTAGICVLSGLIFHAFFSGGVRRRNLAAPVPPARMSLQIACATAVLCVAGWIWVTLLGFAPWAGGAEVAGASPGRFALGLAASLVYTLVPLSLGYLGVSLGLGPNGLNGYGTILSLALAFLGGLFTADVASSDFMRTLGLFMPTHWHLVAVRQAETMTGTWASVGPYLGALAIEVLFAAVLAAAGLLATRVRMQTAEAGGLTFDED